VISLRNNLVFQAIYLLCFSLINLSCVGTERYSEDKTPYETTSLHPSNTFTAGSVLVDQKTEITFDGGRLKSALALYKNYENSPHVEFIETADQIFFKTPDSSKVRGAGIVGAIGGLFPSTPMTGLIIWSIGDFLGIPPGMEESITLSSGIMITTTPVFVRQFYERGRTIMAWFAGEELFQKEVVKVSDTSSIPFTYQKSKTHHLANLLIFSTSIIEATFYTSLMVTSEEKFPVVAAITGAPFFFSFWERYYDIGARHIHDLFNAHYYGNKDIRKKRAILLLMIKQFQKAIAENSAFAKGIYNEVRYETRRLKDSHKSNFSSLKSYFALSAFLLKGVENVPEKPQGAILEEELRTENDKITQIINKLIEDNNELRRYKAQTEELTPSLSEEFLNYLSILTTGCASGGRLASSQYTLETLLTALFSNDTAYVLAWVGAGVDLAIKIGTEYKTQKGFFQNCRTWSCNSFFEVVRNGIGTNALAYGGLFALARTIPGLANFARWGTVPKFFQAATLLPAFVGDTVYYQQFLKEKGQSILTALLTAIPKKHTIDCGNYQPTAMKERSECGKCTEEWRKHAVRYMPTSLKKSIRRNARHAWLYKWSEDLYNVIHYTWNDQAIDSFYKITQENGGLGSALKPNRTALNSMGDLMGSTESAEEL